jgi:hypothetical protein
MYLRKDGGKKNNSWQEGMAVVAARKVTASDRIWRRNPRLGGCHHQLSNHPTESAVGEIFTKLNPCVIQHEMRAEQIYGPNFQTDEGHD